jgi:hypothetical protein
MDDFFFNQMEFDWSVIDHAEIATVSISWYDYSWEWLPYQNGKGASLLTAPNYKYVDTQFGRSNKTYMMDGRNRTKLSKLWIYDL